MDNLFLDVAEEVKSGSSRSRIIEDELRDPSNFVE
jgi:hypothetical protein